MRVYGEGSDGSVMTEDGNNARRGGRVLELEPAVLGALVLPRAVGAAFGEHGEREQLEITVQGAQLALGGCVEAHPLDNVHIEASEARHAVVEAVDVLRKTARGEKR